MADYYMEKSMEAEWDAEIRYRARVSKAREIKDLYQSGVLFWETKDGSKIHTSAMTDSHLINTISWLKRKDEDDVLINRWIEILEIEKLKRTI